MPEKNEGNRPPPKFAVVDSMVAGSAVIYGGNARDAGGRILSLAAGVEGIAVNRIGHRFYFVIRESGLAAVSFQRRPAGAGDRIENVNLLDGGWLVWFVYDAAAAGAAGLSS